MTPEQLRELRRRLDALRVRTTASGCTEAEALAAAEKYAELLTRYGLSEADVAAIAMDEVKVPVRAKRSAVDAIWASISTFSGCLLYWQTGGGEPRCAVYFGRVSDVMVAEYLHEVLARALAQATAAFRKSPDYKRRRLPRTRNEALRAFEWGFATRILEALDQGLWRRLEAEHGDQAKAAAERHRVSLREALAKRNVRLTTNRAKDLKPPQASFGRALAAGSKAGAGVPVNPGVGGPPSRIAGLLR